MKRHGRILLAAILIFGGVFAYAYRAALRDWWFEVNRPTIPAAAKYVPPSRENGVIATADTSLVEGGVATSQHYVLVSSPPVASCL